LGILLQALETRLWVGQKWLYSSKSQYISAPLYCEEKQKVI